MTKKKKTSLKLLRHSKINLCLAVRVVEYLCFYMQVRSTGDSKWTISLIVIWIVFDIWIPWNMPVWMTINKINSTIQNLITHTEPVLTCHAATESRSCSSHRYIKNLPKTWLIYLLPSVFSGRRQALHTSRSWTSDVFITVCVTPWLHFYFHQSSAMAVGGAFCLFGGVWFFFPQAICHIFSGLIRGK